MLLASVARQVFSVSEEVQFEVYLATLVLLWVQTLYVSVSA